MIVMTAIQRVKIQRPFAIEKLRVRRNRLIVRDNRVVVLSTENNPSCYLLEIHELLRFNEGEISLALGQEEAHGRKNYSDVLPV